MKSVKELLVQLAAVTVCFAPHGVQAMTVEVHGNQVFTTGPVEDDLRKFEEAFAKPGVDTVVFVNSPGGDLWTGLRVGQLIADKGLKTVIAGSCISACSIMFMGGKERRFSDAFRPSQTMIGIHGAHSKDTKQINPVVQPQIFAFYKLQMGGNFNSEVMNKALYDMEDAGSLLRIFDPVRSGKVQPYHCVSAHTPRSQCTKIEGQTAVSLGIVTEADLLKVKLPTSMLEVKTIFGKALGEDIEDLPVTLQNISQKVCSDPVCARPLLRFVERKENRALATSLQGEGWGLDGDADSPNIAALRALYSCNHPRNTTRPTSLCQVSLVNSFDTRAMHEAAVQAHEEQIAKITVPNDKHYANEEFGGGFSGVSGYRFEKLNDMTPQKLNGISTVNTQEVAKMLRQPKTTRPVMLDTNGNYDTIPSALAFLNAGFAFQDLTREASYDKRFASLLKLLAPDPQAPLIFFCAGRNCWSSINAALRAKQHGYSQVMWYRGGIESWKSAQLPTAPGIYQANAN